VVSTATARTARARADRLATARTARARAGKLAADPVLRRYVEDKLALCWSPAQISRRLVMDFPHDEAMRVSHETIYTSLFVQAKGVLRPELTGQLRTRRVRRRPHRRVSVDGRRSRIPDLVPISMRPAPPTDANQGTGRMTCWSAGTAAVTWSRWSNGTPGT
jgi:transposase, IS30 family